MGKKNTDGFTGSLMNLLVVGGLGGIILFDYI